MKLKYSSCSDRYSINRRYNVLFYLFYTFALPDGYKSYSRIGIYFQWNLIQKIKNMPFGIKIEETL